MFYAVQRRLIAPAWNVQKVTEGVEVKKKVGRSSGGITGKEKELYGLFMQRVKDV